jgi:thiol-disulfide isomerase/thioredoxin
LWLGAVALGLGLQISSAEAGQIKVGDSFPDLTKFQLEGRIPDSLHGKVVIVDFWASWCGPCKASFPAMEQLQKSYGDKGLVILAVNLDDKRAEMDAFLKKNPASFTVVRDAEKKLVAAACITSMPTSFVLDGEGKVRAIHNGFHGDGTKKHYVEEIENLLKTTVAQATP